MAYPTVTARSTRMADPAYYQNHLKKLLDDPSSFQGTPGFQFALDTGLDAVGRSNSRQRGSGNALAALTQYGTGLAQQDYGAQVGRLAGLSGQEQQYDLGEESNRLTSIRDENAKRAADADRVQKTNLTMGQQDLDRALGFGQLGLGRDKMGLDRDLGFAGLANQRRGQDLDYGLGTYRAGNEYQLGSQANANNAQRNWFDYDINSRRTDNDFNLGAGRNQIDWFNAGTNRGAARSRDYYAGSEDRRLWMPYTHVQGPGGYRRAG